MTLPSTCPTTRLDRQLAVLQGRRISSLSHLRTLLQLARMGRCSARSIAEAINVTPANMTSILNSMVRSGLVNRSVNRMDRRKVLLELTPAGRDYVEALCPGSTGMASAPRSSGAGPPAR